MAINDVAGEWVYRVICSREFLGHNFANGVCRLKPKKLKKN